MALPSIKFWEVVLDGTQIFLCIFILLFVIRNNIKNKQLISKALTEVKSHDFNAEFAVEAIRQQSELAFDHIVETIDKERNTLNAYFELNETQISPNLLKSMSVSTVERHSHEGTTEGSAADVIYQEIENLAEQGMSLTDISEKLKVPKGEVDLVLKLKRLSIESGNHKARRHSPLIQPERQK